jgi:hypothetical protein
MRWSSIIRTGLCACAFLAGAARAEDKPPFPRLAVNWLSNQHYEDPAVQRELARGDIALINVWVGWESGRGTTVEQVVKNIKALNPKTRVFLYEETDSIPKDASQVTASVYKEMYTKIDAMKWRLYPIKTTGTPVDSFWPGAETMNNSLYAAADSNGDRWVDYYAKWLVKNIVTPSPSVDGLLIDNFFVKPRVNGDWNMDGATDNKSDATVGIWQRQGLRRHLDDVKKLMPGKLQLANIADWGDPASVLPEYEAQLNGGLIEGTLGYTWSRESWDSWQGMMNSYRKIMSKLAEPKLGIFHQVGTPTDYKAFRYGFSSCLLDNGYYAYNTSMAYGDAPFFDEYNVKLGQAVTGPQTVAWQKGVYRRDFENGIVLVNPKGNGSQTITLEGDFKRVAGTQDKAVNSGQTTRTVTLADRDGIVLLRLNPKAKPKPPVLAAQ